MEVLWISLAYLVGMVVVGVVSYFLVLTIASRFDWIGPVEMGFALIASLILLVSSLIGLAFIAVVVLTGTMVISQIVLGIVLGCFSWSAGVVVLSVRGLDAYGRAVRISI